MNEPKVELSGGGAVTEDHRDLKENGQQKGYIVLSADERAKGFVRPYRDSYVHVGLPAPRFDLLDLTPEQVARYGDAGYVKYETYPESESPVAGRYWTQAQLDKIGKGCRTLTRMSRDIAETYARDPHFYGGTFCCGCRTHLPLNEFVWDGTQERVGS